MHDAFQQLPPEIRKKIEMVIEGAKTMVILNRQDFFVALNKAAKPGGIVFSGDSITEGFALSELFPRDWPLYNRGIGGLTSKQLLDNLDAHITGLSPKKVFLLIGTNDIAHGESPEDIAEKVKNICEQTLASCDRVKVYVLAVYPISTAKADFSRYVGLRNNASINLLNKMLQTAISNLGAVTFIDLGADITDSDGNLRLEYTVDGLHLSVEAYQKIAMSLLPYIRDDK